VPKSGLSPNSSAIGVGLGLFLFGSSKDNMNWAKSIALYLSRLSATSFGCLDFAMRAPLWFDITLSLR
jgi:hypothetical protein